MRYFYYELPKIDAWLGVVSSRDMTCASISLRHLMKRDDVLRMIGAVLMFAGRDFWRNRAPRG